MTDAVTFDQYRDQVEAALEQYLDQPRQAPERLHQAMRYSVLGGGKKLRPVLALASCQALGGDAALALPAACALELIHAYSLVHDDLPAMDDDRLRRGQPTCHIAFDEATAILCGDALQALAFEIISQSGQLEPARQLAMVGELARAAGRQGMVGGQAIDLAAVGHELDLEQLKQMHRQKTGALIESACILGAMAAGETRPDCLQQLRRYGEALGLAFQVKDDILDVEGETDTLGKQNGADAERNKPTFPAFLGLAPAREYLEALHQDACQALNELEADTGGLRLLADFVVDRHY